MVFLIEQKVHVYMNFKAYSFLNLIHLFVNNNYFKWLRLENQAFEMQNKSVLHENRLSVCQQNEKIEAFWQ